MTITSTDNQFEIASAGAGPAFTYPYAIHKATDIKVYVDGAVKETSDGTYPHTVVVAANKESAIITFTDTATTAVTGLAIIFERILEYKQETDLANNSLFDAESLETSLDNIVMQLQQVGNVVLGSTSSSTFSFDAGLGTSTTGAGAMYNSNAQNASTLSKLKAARANKALAFDSNGDITVTTSDIDSAIDYTLEAEEWASLASGNVYSYTAGSRAADQGAISAKAQATASGASATNSANSFASLDIRYLGAYTTVARETGVNVGKDNNGDPLIDGALYFDSTDDVMKVWDLGNSVWVKIKPTTTEQTAITAVNADAVDIGKVAAIDTEIGYLVLLGTNGVDITTVSNIGTNGADVSTVAALPTGDVTKVAAVDGEVADVAAIDTEITTLINGTDGLAGTGGTTKNILLVNGVYGKLTEVGNLGTSTVVGYMTALNGTNVITHMAALNATNVITNIGLVAAVDTEIGQLAVLGTAGADISTVAGLGTAGAHVTTVAGLNTEVAALGASAVVGYMTALNGTNVITHMANLNATNIITYIGNLNAAGVLTNIANLNAAGVITNIAALNAAGVIVDIGDVAAVDAEIVLLGTPAMATASTGHLARLGTSTVVGYMTALGAAGVIGDIETVADNLTNIDNFKDLYQIHNFASDPTLDGGGNPIAEGDLAYDSTANTLKIYTGSGFDPISTVTEVSSDTTPVLGGNLDVNDKIITTTSGHIAFDKGVTEKVGSSTVGTTVVTVDLATGNFFEVDFEGLTGNVLTFTISNIDATSSMVSNFVMKIIQGTTTTTRNFTWATVVSNGTNIDWAGGAGPDITTGPDKVDILSFTSYDQGTTWYGATVGQDFS